MAWRLTVRLALLAGGSTLAGFLTNWYVLVVLGPGVHSDALFASAAVPQLVLAIASGPLAIVLIPMLARKTGPAVDQEAWGLLATTGICVSLLALLLAVLAPLWVRALTPGFAPDVRTLTVTLTRVQLVGVVLIVLNAVQSSVQQTHGRFARCEASNLAAALMTLGLLAVLLPRYGVVAAAAAWVARPALLAIMLAPGFGRFHGASLRAADLRDLWRRLQPPLAGAVYFKTDPLVDRALSSLAPPGQLSLLYLVSLAYTAASHVLNRALSAPAVPALTRLAVREDWTGFQRVFKRRLWSVAALSAGIYAVIVVLSPALLARSRWFGLTFTADQQHLIWILFVALGGHFIASCAGQIGAGAFYARGNTLSPVRIAATGFTLGVVLKFLGFYTFGVAGIALATSFYYILNLVLLLIIGRRQIDELSPRAGR